MPQGKFSVNGPSLNHLHALSASRLNLSNTLSLAASHILKMAVTLGAIIQFFSILQKHFPPFQTARCMPIFHLFLSPSLITGDSLRSDLVLITKSSSLYILELALGFESNMQINSNRKATKYKTLVTDLNSTCPDIKFVNLSMSAFGILVPPLTHFFQFLRISI